MKKIKPSILPGFMELLPKEQLIFNDLVNKITRTYEANGYLPIDTPIIEKEEILLAKYAVETQKQVYHIAKDSMPQALRFDLTVPFARYVVQHAHELTFPFKRYQLGKVYRGERNQKGRYREFYQLDVDIVNPNKLAIANDAFIIQLAAQAFKSIGLNNYKFQISNRKILAGLLEMLNVPNAQEVLTLIDKYDKIGPDNCYQSIEEITNPSTAQVIKSLLSIPYTLNIITDLKTLANNLAMRLNQTTTSPAYTKILLGISELEEMLHLLEVFKIPASHFAINLKIIRGLDYYTGTIFETFIQGNENYGSICSGGRYDTLCELYTDQPMSGVGISIGVTRLFFVLKEIGFLDDYQLDNRMQYLIAPLGDTLDASIQINHALQQQGIKSEIYLNQDPLKKQLRYANAQGINHVILVGEDELANNTLIIKDMITGTQSIVNKEAWLQA